MQTKHISKGEARTKASKEEELASYVSGGKGGRHRKARGSKTGDQVPAWAPESLLDVAKSLDITLSPKGTFGVKQTHVYLTNTDSVREDKL